MSDAQSRAEAKLWRNAATGLANELEALMTLLNNMVFKENPLPMPPSVKLYKLTVEAIEAAESGDVETMGRTLREARHLVGIPGEDL